MRRADRHRLKLEPKQPRREPDEIITRFVPCARAGKSGKHPVTLTLVGNHSNGKADYVVIGATCGCEGIDKTELDAIKRLGGDTCMSVLLATKALACHGERGTKKADGSIDLGYSFSQRRGVAKAKREPQEPDEKKAVADGYMLPETAEERWNRLFSFVAKKAAGDGFAALRVARAPTNGDLLMFFGNTKVSERVSGTWKIDEVELTENLAHSSGHKEAHSGGYCKVCGKTFAHFDPHSRKSRHIEKVIEGLKRAMYRLRKRIGMKPHKDGGWRPIE
jgi:hypothetical protein